MDLEKESGMLTLIFADDTVQYRDRILPTGSIACMAMNISKEMLEESLPLCQRIAAVNTMLRTGTADKTAMKSACLAAHSLLKLIAQHEPFTFFPFRNWISGWIRCSALMRSRKSRPITELCRMGKWMKRPESDMTRQKI